MKWPFDNEPQSFLQGLVDEWEEHRQIVLTRIERVFDDPLHEVLRPSHILPRSQKAISGSTIQNSLACLDVLEFSAEK